MAVGASATRLQRKSGERLLLGDSSRSSCTVEICFRTITQISMNCEDWRSSKLNPWHEAFNERRRMGRLP